MGKSPSSFSLQPSRRVSPVLRIPDLPFRAPQKSFTAPDCKDFSKKYRKLSLYRRLKNFLARSKMKKDLKNN